MTTSDTADDRLHRAGWTVGDTAFSRPPGIAWRVYGRNGENVVMADGKTRDEAWQAGVEQARAARMIGE